MVHAPLIGLGVEPRTDEPALTQLCFLLCGSNILKMKLFSVY